MPNGTDIEFKAFPTVKERTVDGQNRNYIVWQILEYSTEGTAQEGFTHDLTADYEPLQEGDIPFFLNVSQQIFYYFKCIGFAHMFYILMLLAFKKFCFPITL